MAELVRKIFDMMIEMYAVEEDNEKGEGI